MIYNNVILTLKDANDAGTVRSMLTELATASLAEPGCARFEVYHSQDDRRVFMLVERWETQAHLDTHREAKAFTALYVPKVLPLLERVPHPCDLVIG